MVSNSFVWAIFTFMVLGAIINELSAPETEKTILFFIFYLAVGVGAIFGAKFFPRARIRSLKAWFFLSGISTYLLTFVHSGGIIVAVLLIFFYGASTGIGLPSCLGYFAESTEVGKRGFISGLIWGIVGFSVLFLAFLTTIFTQWETILVLASWRFFGGIGFIILNRKNELKVRQKSPSYLELIRKKEILLYLFPWAMFCILNFAEAPIWQSFFGADFAFSQLMIWGIAGFVAIIGGLIADSLGRKVVVIAGFLMLGIEYAIFSVSINSQTALYFLSVLDGISWGLLCSVFLTAIWGDLGENSEKEKYYVLGGLTFFFLAFYQN